DHRYSAVQARKAPAFQSTSRASPGNSHSERQARIGAAMITVWQGSVNTWDCDEMGHMNVRVYVEKAQEGLGALAHALDLPRAFHADGYSTLLPTDQHIRFLKEALPGAALGMQACILEIGESDALVYQEMRHSNGDIAAAFRTRLRHAEVRSGRAFPWSERTLSALERLKGRAPKSAAPRSIDPAEPVKPANQCTVSVADAAGAKTIGRGMVPPAHLDTHGRMSPQWIMGRLSDSVPFLLADWRSRVAEASGGVRMGGAVLEYRLLYHHWPTAGDLFEVRTSLARVEKKFHSLVHWVLDPVTGLPWATTEAVAVTLDIDARKIIPTPKPLMDELAVIAPGGLSI
ncbi:MAG: thioesterase family protein, partial [Pseudomonadota bacterium]